jgi:hypothetical protein
LDDLVGRDSSFHLENHPQHSDATPWPEHFPATVFDNRHYFLTVLPKLLAS